MHLTAVGGACFPLYTSSIVKWHSSNAYLNVLNNDIDSVNYYQVRLTFKIKLKELKICVQP